VAACIVDMSVESWRIFSSNRVSFRGIEYWSRGKIGEEIQLLYGIPKYLK
jgi:hypothetical protein